jgi:hypothetical protein
LSSAVLTESFGITVAAIVLASVWVATAVVSLCVRSLRTAELNTESHLVLTP